MKNVNNKRFKKRINIRMVGFLGVMKLISMIKCFNETKMLRKCRLFKCAIRTGSRGYKFEWAQQK